MVVGVEAAQIALQLLLGTIPLKPAQVLLLGLPLHVKPGMLVGAGRGTLLGEVHQFLVGALLVFEHVAILPQGFRVKPEVSKLAEPLLRRHPFLHGQGQALDQRRAGAMQWRKGRRRIQTYLSLLGQILL